MHNPLSEIGRQIVLGTMMGDGYLYKNPTCRHAGFETNARAKFEDYLFWKYEHLKVICNSEPRYYESMRNDTLCCGYHLRTQTHSMFTQLRRHCYNGKQRVASGRVLNHLTDVGLAVWYLDDGNLCVSHRPNGSPRRTVDLHIERYQPTCCDVIRRWFEEKFGIIGKLMVHYFSYVQERPLLYFRISVYDAYHILRPVIAHVVEQISSMRWKLDFQYPTGKSPNRGRLDKPGQSAHTVIRAWLRKYPDILRKYPHAMPV